MNINNSSWQAYIDLTSAYGSTGQVEKARQTLAEVNKIHPNFTLLAYRQIAYAFSSNPQYRHEIDDIVEGLRKGGIPEQ
jgi:hypothetical protein